jgi:hypothetical protein
MGNGGVGPVLETRGWPIAAELTRSVLCVRNTYNGSFFEYLHLNFHICILHLCIHSIGTGTDKSYKYKSEIILSAHLFAVFQTIPKMK